MYPGNITGKKEGSNECIQARLGKERQAFGILRPMWRFTNNQDQFESLWMKCEGLAQVWF